MENLVKNCTADQNNTVNELKKQLDRYRPLKLQLDAMRQDIGLPASPGIEMEEFEQAANE